MRRKREETTRNYVSREKRSLMEENIRPIFFRPTVYVYTQLSGGSGGFDFFAFRCLRTEETGKKTLQNRRDNNRIRFWKISPISFRSSGIDWVRTRFSTR